MGKFLLGLLAGLLLAAAVGWFAYAGFPLGGPRVRDGSILVLRLEGEVSERGASGPVSLGGPSVSTGSVYGLWRILGRAATDPRIRAVALLPESLSTGWAILAEIRSGLLKCKAAGKPIFAYLRQAGTREYYLATTAARIAMPPEDLLNVKGLRVELLFLRKGLDKLGIEPEIEHIGKYKDAADTLTRSSMTPETREVVESLLDARYRGLTTAISQARKKTEAQTRDLIDNGPFLSSQALQAGLIDALLFEDQFFEEAGRQAGLKDVRKIEAADYDRATSDASGVRIALVLAEGDILRGEGNTWRSNEEIASAPFSRVLREVAGDSSIRGVILRVNSPGGDALASDEILRQARLLSKKKPTVISMSDLAASGGYSISLTGDPILAYPETLTGSIGVIYGKLNLRGLYDKLGVTKEILKRGRFADIDSDYEPLGEAGRKKLREGLESLYASFVKEVADARHKTSDEIDRVAQGRVWLGTQAKDLGLIDELGGMDRAVELVKQRARIAPSEKVRFLIYPKPKRLLDYAWDRAGWGAATWTGGFTGVLKRMPYEIEAR
jgi:protease IV